MYVEVVTSQSSVVFWDTLYKVGEPGTTCTRPPTDMGHSTLFNSPHNCFHVDDKSRQRSVRRIPRTHMSSLWSQEK